MAYAQKTSNIMDVPLAVSSVFAPYVGDNGYKFEGFGTIRVMSIADGSLANYDETSATAPMGSPSLVVPTEQVLTLAYNKSMLLRIQRTQIQDIPVSQFSKTTAMQQIDRVFIPSHDAYSLGKVFAARPSGNVVQYTTGRNDFGLKLAIDKARTNGSSIGSLLCWMSYTLSSQIQDKINYTGSDTGFGAGKAGYLGKIAGVNAIEIPDLYLFGGVYALIADKSAIVNVTPKMDPKAGGMVVIDPVPLFSGIEIQLRDRADTFVLSKHVNNVASLETSASTTTTT